MKLRTTVILVGVFLALLAYVYGIEVRRPAESGPATPASAPLWTIQEDQVTGLTIRGEGKETRLSRPAGGEWRLNAPQAAAADPGRVSQVLYLLASAVPSRTFIEGLGPLEEYGLVQPSLEVTVQLAGGSTMVLQIGAANPQQTAYYAQVKGQPGVHLLSSALITSLRELLDTPPLQPTPAASPALTATPAS